MCGVSCDICKFSISHDYVPNHYYCSKNLFFNDRFPISNCDKGEVDESDYKYKYGTSYTMKQFKETAAKIAKLRNEEKQLIEQFEKSTGDLEMIFECIIRADLDGRKYTYLTVNTCTQSNSKKLKDMGFKLEEKVNANGDVRGYYIRWE